MNTLFETGQARSSPLTQQRLKSLLSYDPDTGVFRWIKSTSNRAPIGAEAGCPNSAGYLRIKIDGKYYYCHRLAVLYMTGEWPTHLVDHKFHNISDNRWSEIRPATPNENQQNRRSARASNATGILGVSKHGSGYRAQFMRDGVVIRVGTFRTPEAARDARAAAIDSRSAA